MKKLSLLISSLLVGVASYGGLVEWSSTNLAQDPEVGTSLQAGWLVVMFQDVSENNASSGLWYNELRMTDTGTITSSGVTSDDIMLAYQTSIVNPFLTVMTLNAIASLDVTTDNADVYTVVFNAASIGTASQFVVADSTPFDVGAIKAPDTPKEYNLGNSIAGEFQAIPEPAVASFLVIFGGGMLISRRIFSKA